MKAQSRVQQSTPLENYVSLVRDLTEENKNIKKENELYKGMKDVAIKFEEEKHKYMIDLHNRIHNSSDAIRRR